MNEHYYFWLKIIILDWNVVRTFSRNFGTKFDRGRESTFRLVKKAKGGHWSRWIIETLLQEILKLGYEYMIFEHNYQLNSGVVLGMTN